ncbi:hypothetical protein [Aliamphritea spongicola]|nr:hypothetical protein [Aliamphritea spongicola]
MEGLNAEFWGMTPLVIGYLFAAGILCGVINAVVGGATLVGFPVLISVGLPPNVANASNFLATVPGYAAAIPFICMNCAGWAGGRC